METAGRLLPGAALLPVGTIDEDTAGDYDYTSSIASQTYDKVKLTYENKDTGKREVYIAQDKIGRAHV